MSNLSPLQTKEDILEVLKELDNKADFEVDKPPELNKKNTSSAFTIKAPSTFQSTLLNPDFWPANTYVNRYFSSRRKDTNFSDQPQARKPV